MKRLLAFLALCIPIYILAQGFGSFTHDQPYFAADRGGSGELEIPSGNLFVWLKPETLVGAEGVGVTNWIDSSGLRHDVTNKNAGVQQPYITNNILNGYKGVRLQEASSGLYFGTNDGQSFLQNQDGLTLHFVIRPMSDVPGTFFLAGSTNADNTRLALRRVTSATTAQICIVGRAPDSQALQTYVDTRRLPVTGAFEYWTYVFWFTNATAQCYRNGVLQFTKTSFAGPSATQDTPDTVIIGFNESDGMDCELVEMIGYTNAQSNVQLANTFQYIENKFFSLTNWVDLGSWNPTTNSSLLSAYDIRSMSATNGEIVTSIPDLGPKAYHLRTTNSPMYLVNVPDNGIPRIAFNVFGETNQMAGTNVSTTYPQPTMVFMVMNSTFSVEGSYDFMTDNCDAPGVTGVAQQFLKDASNLSLYSGAQINVADTNQSVLKIYELYFDGLNSYIKTNNVTMVSGNTGTEGRHGIAIAGARNWDFQYIAPMNFYWAAFYTNTLSSTERSNNYYYLQNSFRIQNVTY